MSIALITGSGGLIGSQAATFFHEKGMTVVGIDNDLRSHFFGPEASTQWKSGELKRTLPRYQHHDLDIRNSDGVFELFQRHGRDTALVVHAAAQPSHDWAARDPMMNFSVNANGTLVLLEAVRRYSPDAVFVFTSTNKVYGDRPNSLPLIERETRWEIEPSHPYFARGIDETMSVDGTLHSLFGVSKLAADLMVQEYGRYFGLKTGVFRGGCLTGPAHSGAELHGFLSYLVRCAVAGTPYTVHGYKGKQVRDNIHSFDLINAFWHFFRNPRAGEVYNMGGSRHSNCSMLEAIALIEKTAGRRMEYSVSPSARMGDHMWWISDVSKFQAHYPQWKYAYDLPGIIGELVDSASDRIRTVARRD
jgi:CDP-paratose 2-epimerase